MQAAQVFFLTLFLAHLLGDFILQPKWMVQNKDKQLRPLLYHGLAHYLLAWACLFFFAAAAFLSVYNQAVIIGYALVHLSIDKLKSLFIARDTLPDNWLLFLLDQLLHVIVLAIAACALARSSPAALFHGFSLSMSARIRIVQASIVYIATVFGGGYFIRYLTRGFAIQSSAGDPSRLQNAGLYVGWIERFLIVTAVAMQSPVLVGLILTGKSIARFPEFKEARFAEYFLIGTMLSIAISLIGGILLSYLIYGTVSLK